jgi:cobalt-zinc-cadmium resistance protein CzcA
MIANLMALSVRARWTVLALFLVIAGLGVWQLTKLPIDAVPDITTKQVQINTVDPRLSPVEIEKLVTYPVEISLAGIPGLETTRSISRNGFSQVSAIFTDSTDLYFARQQVGERLRQAAENLPDGVERPASARSSCTRSATPIRTEKARRRWPANPAGNPMAAT